MIDKDTKEASVVIQRIPELNFAEMSIEDWYRFVSATIAYAKIVKPLEDKYLCGIQSDTDI